MFHQSSRAICACIFPGEVSCADNQHESVFPTVPFHPPGVSAKTIGIKNSTRSDLNLVTECRPQSSKLCKTREAFNKPYHSPQASEHIVLDFWLCVDIFPCCGPIFARRVAKHAALEAKYSRNFIFLTVRGVYSTILKIPPPPTASLPGLKCTNHIHFVDDI